MAWFLDSSICIAYLRGAPPQLKQRWQQHRPEDVAILLTVYAELLVGVEKSSARERSLRQVQKILQPYSLVELTQQVAEEYARIRADLERRGAIIGENDLWIAATALTHGATLVTNNTREFSRVRGLALEDWTV